uniref:Ion channel n=1 Tax=Syphacia muris TaxID=451379 RepID=A0A0N5A8X3_9BILA
MFFEAIPNRLKKPLRTALPHVGLATCSIVYVCFGAVLFHQIEHPYEMRSMHEAFVNYENIKQELINRTLMKYGESYNPTLYVDTYIKELLRLLEDPQADTFFASHLKLQSSDASKWTPMSSFLLAATTVIPVGYGFITPATKIGRLLIIIYGLFGAPLALVTITDIGEFMSPHLLKFFERIPGLNALYCLILLAIYIIICALVFHALSPISLLDSVYFSITTVFTIGYGDTPPPIPIPTLIIFIIVGVTLVTITVEIVASEVINQIHYMGRKMENAKKYAAKMLQVPYMAHFMHMRNRERAANQQKLESFANLRLLMSMEQHSILLERPPKKSLPKAFAPENLSIEYADISSPTSMETFTIDSNDLTSIVSLQSGTKLSVF